MTNNYTFIPEDPNFSINVNNSDKKLGTFKSEEEIKTPIAPPLLSGTGQEYGFRTSSEIDGFVPQEQLDPNFQIPEPKIIMSSLTPSPIGQTPEEQSNINTGSSVKEAAGSLLKAREFLAIPAKKSLEGLKMLTDKIPDPQSTSPLVNIGLGLPKTTAEVGSEFAASFIHPDTLALVAGLKGAGAMAKTETGQKIIAAAVNKIPEFIRRAFTYRFGQPQIYKEAAEQTAINLHIGNEMAGSIGGKVAAFPAAEQRMITQYLRGEAAELTPELKTAADAVRAEFTRLGKDAVDLGLLPEKIYQKNIDTYLPRLYRSKEVANATPRLGSNKPLRANLDRFKKLQDIPQDVREGMGEILEAGYPTTKGLLQLNQAVEKARMFRNVSNMTDIATGDAEIAATKGFAQLPIVKSLGDLSGKYVHPEVHADLMHIIKPPPQGIEKAWLKSLGAWKFGKVVLSPSTHMRNIFTNSFWLDVSGVNHATQARLIPKMIKEIINKGDLYKLAKQNGLIGTELVGTDIKPFQLAMEGRPANNVWEWVKKASDASKKLANKAGNIYQGEEQVFKLVKFQDNMSKGMPVKEAALDAEQWIFNYNKVPPVINAIRNSPIGIPFITYISKALPQLGKAMLQNPLRVWKYKMFFDAMEQTAQKHLGLDEGQMEAVRKKGSRLIPFDRPDGRGQMLDVDFLMPWGELQGAQPSSGLLGKLPPSFTPSGPAYAMANALLFNYDPFFKQPIYDHDKDDFDQKVKKTTNYLAKALMPNLTPGISGVESPFRGGAHFQKLKTAFLGPSYPIDEPLSKTEALFSVGLGLKTGPIDIPKETGKLMQRKVALKGGVITDFTKLATKLSVTEAETKAAAKRLAPKIERIMGIKPDLALLEQGIKVERTMDMSPEQKTLIDNILERRAMKRANHDKPNKSLQNTLLNKKGK